MATTKNITMKQFNGTDYDTLYPKTTSEQVEGIYDKEETLTNNTKSSYGLTEASVPNDVFQKILTNFNDSNSKISDITPKIGDIALSARKGLGSKWLLCNGDIISPTAYPELANLIRGINGQVLSTSVLRPTAVAYYGGRWVATTIASDNNPYILTASDPTGSWSKIQIASLNSSNERAIYLTGVACYNGTWVVVGYYTSTSSNTYPKVYVSTNPTSSSSWTEVSITAGREFGLGDIACYNGTWVAIGQHSSNTGIFVSTNPASSWNFVNMASEDYGLSAVESIYCYNGTWVISGMSRGSYYPAIITSTNPWSTWTQYTLDSTAEGRGLAVTCYNGTWVVAGRTGNANVSSSSNSAIFTTTNLAGTWTKRIFTATGNESLNGVTCCNGIWYAVSGKTGTIYYTTTPASNWTAVTIPPSVTISPTELNSIASSADTWVTVGQTSDDLPYAMNNAYYKLPTISPDRAYAYIRALE